MSQTREKACRAGIARYPWYATGYWVLGKCYEARGDLAAAGEQYGEVEARIPGVPSVKDAMERTRAAGSTPGGDRRDEGTDVEALLRRLQEAKRPFATPSGTETPLVDISTPKGEGSIATVTLAEIYAKQGEYREALEAYRKLIGQRPDEAGRHAVRIAELERLLQSADKLRQA
ncbi:MAG: tetratricopeptide repeat protein [Candidatus Micrarchaeota archaeon]